MEKSTFKLILAKKMKKKNINDKLPDAGYARGNIREKNREWCN